MCPSPRYRCGPSTLQTQTDHQFVHSPLTAILGKVGMAPHYSHSAQRLIDKRNTILFHTHKGIMQKRRCRHCLCPIYGPIINITVIFILKRPCHASPSSPSPFVVTPLWSDQSVVHTKAIHKIYSKKLKATQKTKQNARTHTHKNWCKKATDKKYNCFSSDGN